jgi:hypothetical protein
MRTVVPLTAVAIALACSLATTPAKARARVFVASYGSDSNPCTFGSPCKTFQHAHDAVDAGGEVTAIDSAGFGPINITKAVTITSPDGVEAGIVPPVNGNAITINAGPTDEVQLRGLTIDGSGTAANGIVLNSGAGITVTNCVVQNFAPAIGNGILLQPTSGLSFIIANTLLSRNGAYGLYYHPTSGTPAAYGVIDHVIATDNNSGIGIDSSLIGSTTRVAISNSVASNNPGNGIYANTVIVTGNSLLVSIDGSKISGNGHGIDAEGFSLVLLGSSTITFNTVGVYNNAEPGSMSSWFNNQSAGNGQDVFGNGLGRLLLE